jgi:hypothetical protein
MKVNDIKTDVNGKNTGADKPSKYAKWKETKCRRFTI